MTTADFILRDPIGHYPSATVACFDATRGELPRRQLDLERNVAFLEHLSSAGVPAVLIGASTGQGHLRTPDELEEWFVSAASADLGPTVKMALLRPEDGPDRNARLVELVGALGYSVVFARPGTDLPAYATTENVAANMRPIVTLAAKCQLAIGVYSISDVSGLPLTPEAAVQLRQGPGGDHIVAAKVTEANYLQSTRRFLEHPELRDLKIVQGWDPHIATALGDGPLYDAQGRQRCGVTSGAMSFAIFQYQHMLAAARHDEWQEVELAQQAVTALFRAMQDDPGAFADLQRVKHLMGLGHPLTSQVRPEQVEGVLLALRQLPRPEDRQRLARSLDLMGDGPYRQLLRELF